MAAVRGSGPKARRVLCNMQRPLAGKPAAMAVKQQREDKSPLPIAFASSSSWRSRTLVCGSPVRAEKGGEAAEPRGRYARGRRHPASPHVKAPHIARILS